MKYKIHISEETDGKDRKHGKTKATTCNKNSQLTQNIDISLMWLSGRYGTTN